MSSTDLSPAPARLPAPLSQAEKAAVIVRFLQAEGINLPLARLSRDAQTTLAGLLGKMRPVNRSTLHAVVAEFADALEDIGLAFPPGVEGALAVLDGAISDEIAEHLRQTHTPKSTIDPWVRIGDLEPERLIKMIRAESTEVGAIILSKIKTAKAADVLSRLPGPEARTLAYAISATSSVAPDMVKKIGQALTLQLDDTPTAAFSEGPVERVGAILNFSSARTRDEVLEGLDETDRVFADEVRKAIFTFADIPARLVPTDLPKVLRDVDQAVLVTALAAAAESFGEASEFILSNMSKRMAEQVREEIAERGKVKPADGEAAMTEIVGAIRALEAAGDLTLIETDDD